MSTVPAARAAEHVEATASEHARRLFHAHSRAVAALCRAMLRDAHDAEDAAQETFLSAYRALLSGARPREDAAWIAAIARNECRGRIRGRMARPPYTPLEPDAHEARPAVSDAVELAAAIEGLRAALAELPPREREAVALRELRGLGYDDVAAAMGIRAASVEPLLWRARKRLRERLRDDAAILERTSSTRS